MNEQDLQNLRMIPADESIKREGWDCAKCGHRHTGRTLANICIGCPCPETEPQLSQRSDGQEGP